ncbi:GNAT family N-acetyltransferase (plasmid) [Sphingobium yanoikuyae]|uniref:GNAT family N-acetyltransferase n=1 Tax=Sphingobium yanoikuyae TaxID=13690 RepID=A0A6P1GQ56_SPHYA|nr:GNAT family protein [Sphingobium yanoikuyae]QHD70725.1 GNAT family N-acetyltransferase [Sphingobium yanoikuyae]
MAGLLTGKRIRLTLLEKRHLERRVEFLNDDAVKRTLNFDFPTSLAKTEAWFQKNILSRDRVDFAFERLDDQAIIGFGGLINIDRLLRKAELYIFIGDKSVWGQGYGRDGYKLITNYGFIELGLNKVYLYQLSFNEKAITATKALGWNVDGLLRSDIFSHGELKDQYILSILREEWTNNEIYVEP